MDEQPQQPVFLIEKIYVKGLSLEIPGAPKSFLVQEAPQVNVSLQTEGASIDEGVYEVVITITVTAAIGDKTLFLIEATQAGIFQIRHMPTGDIDPILGVTCPNILFPYVREVISDVVTRAGFPPVLLNPINFEALYQQRLQQAQQTTPAPTLN